MSRKQTYSIGDTAKVTGATQKQIRSWEAKGYIPKAERVVCGQRAYRYFSEEQIELIANIKLYLDHGYTLTAARIKANEGGKKDV